MRRVLTLGAIAGLIVGLFTFWNPTSIGATGIESCSQSSYNVFENSAGNGDGLHVCYPVNFANLKNVVHSQAGLCNAVVKIGDDWNDCISYASNFIGSERHNLCLYVDANYSTAHGWFVLFPGFHASWVFGDTMQDSISSIRWC